MSWLGTVGLVLGALFVVIVVKDWVDAVTGRKLCTYDPRVNCSRLNFGEHAHRHCWEWNWELLGRRHSSENHEAAVAKMHKVKKFMRTVKMRRFLRLCRSKEFNELWYAEGMPGRRWDKNALERWITSHDDVSRTTQ